MNDERTSAPLEVRLVKGFEADIEGRHRRQS